MILCLSRRLQEILSAEKLLAFRIMQSRGHQRRKQILEIYFLLENDALLDGYTHFVFRCFLENCSGMHSCGTPLRGLPSPHRWPHFLAFRTGNSTVWRIGGPRLRAEDPNNSKFKLELEQLAIAFVLPIRINLVWICIVLVVKSKDSSPLILTEESLKPGLFLKITYICYPTR